MAGIVAAGVQVYKIYVEGQHYMPVVFPQIVVTIPPSTYS